MTPPDGPIDSTFPGSMPGQGQIDLPGPLLGPGAPPPPPPTAHTRTAPLYLRRLRMLGLRYDLYE